MDPDRAHVRPVYPRAKVATTHADAQRRQFGSSAEGHVAELRDLGLLSCLFTITRADSSVAVCSRVCKRSSYTHTAALRPDQRAIIAGRAATADVPQRRVRDARSPVDTRPTTGGAAVDPTATLSTMPASGGGPSV